MRLYIYSSLDRVFLNFRYAAEVYSTADWKYEFKQVNYHDGKMARFQMDRIFPDFRRTLL